MEVRSELIDPWIMDLVVHDCTNCIQIEVPSGYLIKVHQTEHEIVDTPADLRELLDVARQSSMEWILIKPLMTSAPDMYLN